MATSTADGSTRDIGAILAFMSSMGLGGASDLSGIIPPVPAAAATEAGYYGDTASLAAAFGLGLGVSAPTSVAPKVAPNGKGTAPAAVGKVGLTASASTGGADDASSSTAATTATADGDILAAMYAASARGTELHSARARTAITDARKALDAVNLHALPATTQQADAAFANIAVALVRFLLAVLEMAMNHTAWSDAPELVAAAEAADRLQTLSQPTRLVPDRAGDRLIPDPEFGTEVQVRRDAATGEPIQDAAGAVVVDRFTRCRLEPNPDCNIPAFLAGCADIARAVSAEVMPHADLMNRGSEAIVLALPFLQRIGAEERWRHTHANDRAVFLSFAGPVAEMACTFVLQDPEASAHRPGARAMSVIRSISADTLGSMLSSGRGFGGLNVPRLLSSVQNLMDPEMNDDTMRMLSDPTNIEILAQLAATTMNRIPKGALTGVMAQVTAEMTRQSGTSVSDVRDAMYLASRVMHGGGGGAGGAALASDMIETACAAAASDVAAREACGATAAPPSAAAPSFVNADMD